MKTYLRISARPQAQQVLDEEEYQVQDLLQAYLETLATQPRPIPLGDVVLPPVVKILDRIRIIVDELRFKGRTNFRYLLSTAKSRLEIVVSFLAVLELVKQRQVHVHQSERFGEIEILPGAEWEEDQGLDLDLEFDE